MKEIFSLKIHEIESEKKLRNLGQYTDAPYFLISKDFPLDPNIYFYTGVINVAQDFKNHVFQFHQFKHTETILTLYDTMLKVKKYFAESYDNNDGGGINFVVEQMKKLFPEYEELHISMEQFLEDYLLVEIIKL
jgi:hypothetical protein